MSARAFPQTCSQTPLRRADVTQPLRASRALAGPPPESIGPAEVFSDPGAVDADNLVGYPGGCVEDALDAGQELGIRQRLGEEIGQLLRSIHLDQSHLTILDGLVHLESRTVVYTSIY